MLTWFVQERQAGLPISGPIVKAQAAKLNKAINGDESEFVASQGWLWRWQCRHGISQAKVVGEKRSADAEGAARFPPKLVKFMEDNSLCGEQIYNADETGLFFKMLPDRTLAMRNDARKTEGYKLAKDRTTVLFCVNKTGTHKLKPLCIGKSAKPCCFHHVNMETMPLAYTASGNAWMTAAIFTEWFNKSFVPSVRRHLRERRLEEKALLLLDNCRAHPPADMLRSADGNITVMYMPPNTTSVIQPLDQGIIAAFKRRYRQELIKEMIISDYDVTQFLKAFYLKQMFLVAGRAWEGVTPTTITNCWMEGLGAAFPAITDATGNDNDDTDFLGFSVDEIRLAEGKLRSQLDVDETLDRFLDEWTTIDESCPVTGQLTDEDIINETPCAVPADAADEEDAETPALPSPAEVVAALEIGLRWIESCDSGHVKVLQMADFLNTAKAQQLASRKQKKLTDFFNAK